MSSNAVVPMQNQALAESQWTPEQMKLITDVIAKGATPDELKLFLYRCKSLGLDPLKPGQIYFIKYGSGPGTIVVGIEGFRSKAARTGKLSGIKRGVLRNEKGECVGAWAEVYRSDWQHPAREEVPLSEYNTGKGNWVKMKETMIKKVAEAAALRMAFPDDLGGVFTKEEMEQAENERGRIAPDQPGENDGNTEPVGYRIGFGQWRGLSIEQVYRDHGPERIASYIQYIEDSAKKKGLEVTGEALRFIEEAEAYLGAMENASREDA